MKDGEGSTTPFMPFQPSQAIGHFMCALVVDMEHFK